MLGNAARFNCNTMPKLNLFLISLAVLAAVTLYLFGSLMVDRATDASEYREFYKGVGY